MFYSCLIIDSDSDDGSDDYYYIGFLEPRGNDLIISCERVASLCYQLFYNNTMGYEFDVPQNVQGFVNLINNRFGNYTWALFSETDVQKNKLFPAEDFSIELAIPKLLVTFNPFSIVTIEE